MSTSARRVPLLIWLLFSADAALAVAPLIHHLAGTPFPRLQNFFDLDREAALPTWYSSMQWFCAGVLFGLLPLYGWRRLPGRIPMAGLTATCLLFSVDEVAGIHEWLGKLTDTLLPGGDRHTTALWSTGLWPFLIGIPVIAVLAIMVYRMRRAFGPAPRALRPLIVGLVIMFSGALVVEFAANLFHEGTRGTGLQLVQQSSEEYLEMLGVSLIVWSAYALLNAYGFGIRIPARFYEPAQKTAVTTDYALNPTAGLPSPDR
jgi:hypothetical protein